MFIARQEEVEGKLTNVISVSADTAWSCEVDGNFILTSYDGSGNTEITISAVNNVDYNAAGEIHFFYEENNCMKQFNCPIWYIDYKWIKVIPTAERFEKALNNEYKAFTVESGDGLWEFGDVPNWLRTVKISPNRFYIIKPDDTNCSIRLIAEVKNDGTKKISILVVNQ